MVVPAETVEETINELLRYCSEGDIIIDHGNSNFKDSRKRAERLAKMGIQYIDCGKPITFVPQQTEKRYILNLVIKNCNAADYY